MPKAVNTSEVESIPKFKRDTPTQDKIIAQINTLNSQISNIKSLQNSGLHNVSHSEVKALYDKKEQLEKELKRLQQKAKWQTDYRIKMKQTIEELSKTNENVAKALKPMNRGIPGRPRIETEQPQLLSSIIDIVQASSSADDRRRTEMIRSVKTLDDLHLELKSIGFNLSRSATYFRLLPKKGNTMSGKRHVQTVPVKLLRPENSLRKKNIDRMYAKSFTDDMKNLDPLFGPDALMYLSIDDKARIPLGLAAANKQSPILMHLDYKIRLSDHDFVIGGRHKLIPSVYAECNVQKNGKVSYSGKTFISVRSGKHDSSTAFTHAYDLKNLFESKDIARKPILLIGMFLN